MKKVTEVPPEIHSTGEADLDGTYVTPESIELATRLTKWCLHAPHLHITQSCPAPVSLTVLQQDVQELRVSYSNLLSSPIFQALGGYDEDSPSLSESFINLVLTSRE